MIGPLASRGSLGPLARAPVPLGPPPEFPLTLGSKAFWYDLRPAYTTVATGDIGAAQERFGLLADAAQATASMRPLSDPDAVGVGLPGGDFDAVDESLEAADVGLAGAVWTLYAVAKPRALPGASSRIAIVSERVSGASFSLSLQIFNSGGTSRYEAHYRVSGLAASVLRGSSTPSTAAGHVIAVRHGATSDAMWINGVAESTTYRAGTFVAGATPLAGQFIVGAWTQTGALSGFWNGGIAALIGYNGAHSDTVVADMTAYLQAEYLA